MRMTLTIEDDVAAMIRSRRVQTKKTLKQVINEGLRKGLADQTQPKKKPFRIEPRDLGECRVDNLDNIEEVLERVEGPWHK